MLLMQRYSTAFHINSVYGRVGASRRPMLHASDPCRGFRPYSAGPPYGLSAARRIGRRICFSLKQCQPFD